MSEHTETTSRTSGRRRQPRDEARELLKSLRTENPEADRNALVRLYYDHIRPLIAGVDDPDAVAALLVTPALEWVGANIIDPPQPKSQKPQKTRAERAAEKTALVAEIAARDKKRIDEIVTRRLLEWEIIDGRRLGDLTGADCRNLSERCGVFLHVISDNIPARAKVRNHYTELELQALARHHKLIVP
jgi:hypothetical protein